MVRCFRALHVCIFVIAVGFVAGCSSSNAAHSLPFAAAGEVASRGTSPVALPAGLSTTISRLKNYNVDPQKVFIAGISSGGFFGVQMHVAHSKTFKGAAIYAGGVFYCSTDSVALALLNCGGETLPNDQASYHSTLKESERYLDRQSATGTIDPESDLAGQPVYLWSGTNDSVVNPLEMADLNTQYTHYGARIKFDNKFAANHGWESPDGTVACGTAASPYMIVCDSGTTPYDSVKTWLTEFLGKLHPRNNGRLKGTLEHIDQTEFGASAANSMDTNGYVFVPKDCASGTRCGFVLAMHGCLQSQAVIGTKFVTESGINEWADTNNIVVLYPYAVEAPGPTPYNPNGCWDWWGYDDANYSTKSGTQMSILYAMVERVIKAHR